METYSEPERALPLSTTVLLGTTDVMPINDHELHLLEQIESDPDITQATLADRLDIAVGTVNWHLKRLVSKGYVKVKRAQRRKLRYIITPEGIALRARLTINYIETSMNLYRRTRQRVRELLIQAKQAGHESIYIDGEGDIADICRLTCLEQGVHVLGSMQPAEREPGRHAAPVSASYIPDVPVLEVRGTRVALKL